MSEIEDITLSEPDPLDFPADDAVAEAYREAIAACKASRVADETPEPVGATGIPFNQKNREGYAPDSYPATQAANLQHDKEGARNPVVSGPIEEAHTQKTREPGSIEHAVGREAA